MVIYLIAISSCAKKEDKAPEVKSVVSQSTEVSYPLNSNSSAPVVYLFGETHLGDSQKRVAENIVLLLKETEIDAVMVEQSDKLKYDWSKFKNLESDPDKAIAALQEQMINDADRTNSKLDKFKKYFEGKKIETREDELAILQSIRNDLGDSGITDLYDALKEGKKQSLLVKNTYGKSEYISAADYLYMMLNLKGVEIPFYNIESAARRAEFAIMIKKAKTSEDLDLSKRDDYMIAMADQLIKNNGYGQVILICGAKHLDNLKKLFSEKGYFPVVKYNSLENSFKQDMTVLVKPGYVNRIVSRYQSTSGFTSDQKFVVDGGPSSSLTQYVENFSQTKLKKNDVEIAEISRKFIAAYKSMRDDVEGTSWSVKVAIDASNDIFVIRNGNTITISLKNNTASINSEMPVSYNKVSFKAGKYYISNLSGTKSIEKSVPYDLLKEIHGNPENTDKEVCLIFDDEMPRNKKRAFYAGAKLADGIDGKKTYFVQDQNSIEVLSVYNKTSITTNGEVSKPSQFFSGTFKGLYKVVAKFQDLTLTFICNTRNSADLIYANLVSLQRRNQIIGKTHHECALAAIESMGVLLNTDLFAIEVKKYKKDNIQTLRIVRREMFIHEYQS